MILIKPTEILGARFKVLFCESRAPFSQMVGTGLHEGRTAMVRAVIFVWLNQRKLQEDSFLR